MRQQPTQARFGLEPTRTLAVLLAVAAAAPFASAQVTSYTAKTEGRDTVLTSVTVERGGGPVVYDPSKLIGVRVTHFRSSSPLNVASTAGAGPPVEGARDRLLDASLTTGLINPGGSPKLGTCDPVLAGPDATPGFAVRFDRPVLNLPGDDVVFFEIQPGRGSEDGFHVAPVDFAEGLRAATVKRYDVGFDHRKAVDVGPFDLFALATPPRSLEDVRRGRLTAKSSNPETGFKALAVGIDLSDLGYAPGAAVSELFFQADGGSPVDPVFLAGLPPPDAESLLAAEPEPPPPVWDPGPMLRSALEGPMAGFDEIVFAERISGRDHWYANFGHYCDDSPYARNVAFSHDEVWWAYGEGARLCRLNLRTGRLRVLLEDARGGIRDPQVHYDGDKIVFAYRKGGERTYHLYEIGVDGTGLVQRTDGPDDDIEPTYLPDGGIMFCSSRCRRFVPCWRTRVAVLYRCDADGSNVRMVASNIEHENTPWMLPDGRVLYTRWEYVDRNQLVFHHLWTVNPDGTNVMVYYGNQNPGGVFIDAKPIPRTNRVVLSLSPGHGRPEHMGAVAVIDPGKGPDDLDSLVTIGDPKRSFRDPYPIAEDCFLVADRAGIHVMDGQGRTEPIYAPPPGPLECHEPRPLRPRPREPQLASHVDLARETGRLVLEDVYEGRNMAGVRRGEIKKLLVLEQLPKPINFSGGQEPLNVGGTFALERVLGTVPVEPDGSASMELPALRSLFFVALDEDDQSVKRMQSFVTVQPGETTGCVGCHEKRLQAPHFRPGLAALERPPSRVEPIAGVSEVLDFPRDVQPILDKHCVACHNPDRWEGRIDLTGDRTPLFSVSYWTLVKEGLFVDGRNAHGNQAPRTIGSAASRLMGLLDGSHYEARLSPRERTIVRLWIDSGATYPGTYAALGSGMYPVQYPTETIERRCGPCHAREVEPYPAMKPMVHLQFGARGPAQPLIADVDEITFIRRMAYFKAGEAGPHQSLCNLSRPAKSLLVRAPLSGAAGGLGLCSPGVFADAGDPDYREILEAIKAAAAALERGKRFDDPDFRPNRHYVREMQRFGFLPDDLGSDDPVDVYAVERAYWRSFWYAP